MAETDPKQEAKGTGAEETTPQGGKVWTDAEHDAYVKARIDKQNAAHAKATAEKDARISELEEQVKQYEQAAKEAEAQNKRRELIDKYAKEKGVPSELLRGSTEDEIKAHAEQLAAALKSKGVPYFPDGGKPAGGATGNSLQEAFASFMQSQN